MSHVAIARYICPFCGIDHTRDAEILLDKHLRDDAFEDGSNNGPIVGFKLCEEHAEAKKQDSLTVVEAEKDTKGNTLLKKRRAIIKHDIAFQIFNIPEKVILDNEFIFCDSESMDKIAQMVEKSTEEPNE